MTALSCRRTRCERACVSLVARVSWPVVIGRAVRTLAVLLGVAAAIRVACARPAGSRWNSQRTYQAAARALLRSLRIDLRTLPTAPGRPGPALIVANHVSWLDILVLAASESMVPVAKTEVDGWPVIGPVAREIGAVFIDRNRPRALPETVASMAAALRDGRSVQVFPEATTRCGSALDPFRRAAFQAAIDAGVPVRPVALSYRDVSGRPTGSAAFVGDQTLLASVLAVLRGGPVTATVHWATPVTRSSSGRAAQDRAILAHAAEQAVSDLLDQPVLRRPRRLTAAGPQASWPVPAA